VTIRATPTLTTCTLCDERMAAVRGPFSLLIRRAKPPEGYRLGYVAETDNREIPMCAECIALILRTAA
jgi:hypothetical protein